ncbi:MAG TPA: hypothetical protein VKB49_25760 [Candidatus Sulfotelmatobacter sp.]|nr:hypothetical protein [Candidatus Sulfotelmatobacter sp.]
MSKRTSLLARIISAGLLIAGIAMVVPVVAYADDAKPCAGGEHRQFDYWLGNWSVSYGGPPAGTSKVELALDQCMIVESWDGARNHSGKTIFAYSPDDHSWYGIFADNEGRVHIFNQGKVSAGTAEFQGTSHGPNGETVLNRVKIVRASADKVEQTWEKSADNGATWNMVYRGEYTRK